MTDFYEGKFLTIRHYLVFSSLIEVSWSCARYDTIIEKVSGGIKKELPGICKVCDKLVGSKNIKYLFLPFKTH